MTPTRTIDRPRATARTVIVITGSDPAGPTSARCQTCGATWKRPAGAANADTLAVWPRTHPCQPAPSGLDDLDGPAAAELAHRLQLVALGLRDRQAAARAAQAETAGDGEEAFWRATGRHDGLSEAHAYLLAVVETLTVQGGQR